MKTPAITRIAPRLAIVAACCWLPGCSSRAPGVSADASPTITAPAETPTPSALNFKEQQKKLFYGIDHKLVYQSCQELMRLSRAGKLATSIYFCDDPPAKRSELPEPIRALGPTSLLVNEMMVQMTFLSADGMQYLQCFSNEFGEPVVPEGAPKGSGFRTNPFGQDNLSGQESLDDLNRDYRHFEISLLPGLTYQVTKDEPLLTLEKMKQQSKEGMSDPFAFVSKAINELTIKQQRLLYRTDHHALLGACRESIKRFNEGAFSKAAVEIWPEELLEQMKPPFDREKYAKDLKQIPEIIRGLQPASVLFEKSRVTLVFMGGLGHAGVIAYLNDNEAVPRDDDMELIPGLRYYDDGLQEGREEFLQYLKSLEHETLSPIDWRRKQMNLPLPVRK